MPNRFLSPRKQTPTWSSGYEFEPPPIACTGRLRGVLERMSDAELALLNPPGIAEAVCCIMPSFSLLAFAELRDALAKLKRVQLISSH